MTATETLSGSVTQAAKPLPLWQRALVFGTGVGIAIGAKNLDVTIVRSRPSGASLLAETSVIDFRSRPAAEWGAEVAKFLARHGEGRLSATLLLPRDQVIVRTLNLPGVSDKDAGNAIELQIDTLHPYVDEEVAWGWSRASAGTLLVGLVRKTVLEAWETLFEEAGIGLAAATFSPAVIHPALRIWQQSPGTLLCFHTDAAGRTEVYGESDGRAVYSAEFALMPERALAVARAELRLATDYAVRTLPEALPRPQGGAQAVSALAWAAGIAGSAPRLALANLIPLERRATRDRLRYVIPGVLAALLLIALVVVFAVIPAMEAQRYREALDQASRKLEPVALQAQAVERSTIAARKRLVALDDFRQRPQADLDVLNELTRLLPAPVWTNVIEIYPDSVTISGEADQAAPLLKVLDSSPLFQNSEFVSSVARSKDLEQFRIRTMRRGRTGKVTP